MRKIVIISAILAFSFQLFGQETAKEKGLNAITEDVIKAQLNFLSSDWMEGRETGMKGCYLAADYISSMFQVYELEPGGDIIQTRVPRELSWKGVKVPPYQGYFQNFNLVRKYNDSKAWLSLTEKTKNSSITTSYNEKTDFTVYAGNFSETINAPLIFVGYGIDDETNKFNDFKGIDVKGKIIVRLSGHPGYQDTASLGYKKFHKNERYFIWRFMRVKDEMAQKHGAIGVIEISDGDASERWFANTDIYNMSPNENPQSPTRESRLSIPKDKMERSLPSISLSKRLQSKILSSVDIDIEAYQKKCANELYSASKEIKDLNLELKTKVNTDLLKVRNVIGVIEGEIKDEYVVIGAHYDHVGMANGFIFNGADDNASGTVGVMTLAKAFKASGVKPKRTIVFAAWTGEERGLLGSTYYTQNPIGEDIKKVKLYLNFDMISKDNDDDTLKNQVTLTYTKAYAKFEETCKKNITDYGLDIDMEYTAMEKPRGGSDHTPFANEYVPIMYHMAGFPVTYHTPKDHTYDINWEKMTNIIKVSYLNLWDLINAEEL